MPRLDVESYMHKLATEHLKKLWNDLAYTAPEDKTKIEYLWERAAESIAREAGKGLQHEMKHHQLTFDPSPEVLSDAFAKAARDGR